MFQFIAPCTISLNGPSRSGKTCFIINLVNNMEKHIGGRPIKQILWCYKNENSIPIVLKENPIVQFHKNIPTNLDEIMSDTLLIFDDCMMDSFSKEITEIFTISSHHNNLSVILVLHNLFHQSKFSRNIALNTQYIVYFRNPRDLSSISHLTRQLMPSNSKNLQKLFNEELNKPFTYLIIDLVQDTPEIFRYRTDIFNGEGYFKCFATQSTIDKFQNEHL